MKSWLAVACCFTFLTMIGDTQMNQAVSAKQTPAEVLLVVNQSDQTMSIVDPDAGREIAKVRTNGTRGHEVIASADGRLAYVPIYGDSGVGLPGTDGRTIEVIDLATQKVVNTFDLGRSVRPHCARLGPDGLLYVTAELENAVDIVDPHSQKRIGAISTGRPQSHMVVISSDGRRAYTSNVSPGTVSVLDLVTRKPVTVIPVAEKTQRIGLSIDDRLIFTADQTQPRLAVIDTGSNKLTGWIALPSIGYGITPTGDGKWLLVTLPSANQVAVVDLKEMRVARTIPVAAHPVEILIRPGYSSAYVSCTAAGEVDVLDLAEWKASTAIKTAAGADGLAWAARR